MGHMSYDPCHMIKIERKYQSYATYQRENPLIICDITDEVIFGAKIHIEPFWWNSSLAKVKLVKTVGYIFFTMTHHLHNFHLLLYFIIDDFINYLVKSISWKGIYKWNTGADCLFTIKVTKIIRVFC